MKNNKLSWNSGSACLEIRHRLWPSEELAQPVQRANNGPLAGRCECAILAGGGFEMAPEPKVEERDVGKDEIKAGVKLRPGHKVVLIIGGSGNPPQDDPKTNSSGEQPAKPGEP